MCVTTRLKKVIIEALKPVRRKAYGSSGCEVKATRIEEVKESVLEDLSPNLEILKVAIDKAPDNTVSYVSDPRL